jgi:hypothetical protein
MIKDMAKEILKYLSMANKATFLFYFRLKFIDQCAYGTYRAKTIAKRPVDKYTCSDRGQKDYKEKHFCFSDKYVS